MSRTSVATLPGIYLVTRTASTVLIYFGAHRRCFNLAWSCLNPQWIGNKSSAPHAEAENARSLIFNLHPLRTSELASLTARCSSSSLVLILYYYPMEVKVITATWLDRQLRLNTDNRIGFCFGHYDPRRRNYFLFLRVPGGTPEIFWSYSAFTLLCSTVDIRQPLVEPLS